ncbi:hypothetical protein TNCV_2078381 [Trichonephila clavipes]|nr:hypothetical protein TNCV_2078381 [Trichonephila clavipes]
MPVKSGEVNYLKLACVCVVCVRVILMSNYKAARRLLVTDLVILDHGQMTRRTPELVPTSLNFLTTPTGGRLSFGIRSVHWPALRGGS